MTTYYLSSVDGDNGSDGLSWANAFATFKYAVETASAAASGPHIVYVDSAHSESLSADTTIAAAGNIRIVCVNRSGGDAPTTGAVVGAQSTNYAIAFNGGYTVYTYGITFKNGTGSTNKTITLNSTDEGRFTFEECVLWLSGTHSNNRINVGFVNASSNSHTLLLDCDIKVGAAVGAIGAWYGRIYCRGLTIDPTGSVPSSFVVVTAVSNIELYGCDLSHITGTLIGAAGAGGVAVVKFLNCKFGSGVTIAADGSQVNDCVADVTAINCSSGDEHYSFYHYNGLGSTTAVTTYYADDGAAYDGTNRCSWKIVTGAYATFFSPYVSPLISVYHSGTSSITPYLEGLRVDSTTVIQDDEVWAEFSFQATSSSTAATFKTDRMALLGTAANQTSSLAYSNWTGSPTDTDSGDSVFKLAAPSATTPAEVGHITARVCVGEPSLTVYIDPQIRGLS